MKMEIIQREMEKAFEEIKAVAGKDVVLVIGVTGAGKSTTVNYLLGHRMKKYRDKVVAADDSRPLPVEIGHGKDAMTFYPGVYTSKEGVVYCDCPGFRDTREEEKKLCVSLSRETVVKEAKSIHAVIVVVDWNSIQAEKGKGLKDVALILGKVFSLEAASFDSKQESFDIQKSLLFVITKTRSDEVDMGYFMEEITGTLAVQKQRLAEETMKRAERRKSTLPEGLIISSPKKEEVDIKKEQPSEENPREVISNLKKTIEILSLMENEKNVILIDVCDEGQTRELISKKLKEMQPIPKSLINFGASDSEVVNLRRQFSEKVVEEMRKAISMLKNIIQLSEEIKKADKEEAELTTNVEKYRKEIQNMESQPEYELKLDEQKDTFVLENKETIKKNEARITVEQKKIEEMTIKLEEDKRTLLDFDTSEEQVFHEESYKEGRGSVLAQDVITPGVVPFAVVEPKNLFSGAITGVISLAVVTAFLPFSSLYGGLKKLKHRFEYTGAPFLTVQETHKHGELKRLTYEPGSGKYIARYKSERGRTGIASIKIIGEKRNKPDIKVKIDELRGEIKTSQATINEAEVQINILNETNKMLEKANNEFIYKKRKEAIETVIEDAISRLKALKEKILSKESELTILEKIYSEKNAFWHILIKISHLVNFNTVIYSTTESEFQDLLSIVASLKVLFPKLPLRPLIKISTSQNILLKPPLSPRPRLSQDQGKAFMNG